MTRSLFRTIFAVLAVMMSVVTGASAVNAQEYPLQDGELRVEYGGETVSQVRQGDQISISGAGFAPGAEVTVTIESDPVVLGTATADGSGTFSGSFEIPDGFDLGSHTVKATGEGATGGTNILSQGVSVTDENGNLPRTGSNSMTLTYLGISLLAFGAVVVLATQRLLGRPS
jgi:LPXTG-motif cell wall-anchored protein